MATDHFHPEWRPFPDDLVGREGVLNLDARKTTHPIQTPVLNEAQAANATFLRMLEAYFGEEPFRKGIRAYMAEHQYSNTTSADLWLALEKASGTANREQRRAQPFQRRAGAFHHPALAARTLQMALSLQLPPQLTTRIVPMVAGNEHIDQAWAVAVANREALVRDRDAIGQNRAFSGIVASPNDAARADMLESYVGQHFGPDALAEAKRVGNGIRIRAALKSRRLPQVRAALK